jgi:hypothetical protein
MYRVSNTPLVLGDKCLTFYRSPVLCESSAIFPTDNSCSVTLFAVDRWLYCVHKVQDYPNVGFRHAVAYHYKTNNMDTQKLDEVCYLATNISNEKLYGFGRFSH